MSRDVVEPAAWRETRMSFLLKIICTLDLHAERLYDMNILSIPFSLHSSLPPPPSSLPLLSYLYLFSPSR